MNQVACFQLGDTGHLPNACTTISVILYFSPTYSAHLLELHISLRTELCLLVAFFILHTRISSNSLDSVASIRKWWSDGETCMFCCVAILYRMWATGQSPALWKLHNTTHHQAFLAPPHNNHLHPLLMVKCHTHRKRHFKKAAKHSSGDLSTISRPLSPTKATSRSLMPPPTRPRSTSPPVRTPSPSHCIQSFQEIDSTSRSTLQHNDKLVWLDESERFVIGVVRVNTSPQLLQLEDTHHIHELNAHSLDEPHRVEAASKKDILLDVAPWSCTLNTRRTRANNADTSAAQSFSYYTNVEVTMHKSDCMDIQRKLPEPRGEHITFEEYFAQNDCITFQCPLEGLRRDPSCLDLTQDNAFLEYNTSMIEEERSRQRHQLSSNEYWTARLKRGETSADLVIHYYNAKDAAECDSNSESSQSASTGSNPTTPRSSEEHFPPAIVPADSAMIHGYTYSAHTCSLSGDSLLVPISSHMPVPAPTAEMPVMIDATLQESKVSPLPAVDGSLLQAASGNTYLSYMQRLYPDIVRKMNEREE